MVSFKLQPSFSVDLPDSADRAVERIRAGFTNCQQGVQVASVGRCADLQIERDQQRFWSPHLSMQIHDTEHGSQLVARFSPRPEILTLVWAIYFIAAILVCGALVYAYVQWFLGETPWALLVIPVCISVMIALHVASVIGQSLSADQMQLLRDQLDCAIQNAQNPTANNQA